MTTIHHVNVMVDDLAAATEFYRDVIGLSLAPTPELGFPAQFFTIAADQELHVNQLDDVHPERAHFCLRVDDFAAIVERARQHGAIDVAAWGLARRIGSGVMQLFVRDPAGNLIELNSQPGEQLDERFLASEFVDPASPR